MKLSHFIWEKMQKENKLTERERQIPYDIKVQNLKQETNELIYETETDPQIQKMDMWFSKLRRDGGRMDWKFGISDANYYIQNG